MLCQRRSWALRPPPPPPLWSRTRCPTPSRSRRSPPPRLLLSVLCLLRKLRPLRLPLQLRHRLRRFPPPCPWPPPPHSSLPPTRPLPRIGTPPPPMGPPPPPHINSPAIHPGSWNLTSLPFIKRKPVRCCHMNSHYCSYKHLFIDLITFSQ